LEWSEIEDIWKDMEEWAIKLGAANTHVFAEAILLLLENHNPDLEVAYEFCDVYSKFFPKELAVSLLSKLTHNGPPLLVALLGTTQEPTALDPLLDIIKIDYNNKDLMLAYVDTIGELGGEKALKTLENIQKSGVPEWLEEELDICLHNLRLH